MGGLWTSSYCYTSICIPIVDGWSYVIDLIEDANGDLYNIGMLICC